MAIDNPSLRELRLIVDAHKQADDVLHKLFLSFIAATFLAMVGAAGYLYQTNQALMQQNQALIAALEALSRENKEMRSEIDAIKRESKQSETVITVTHNNPPENKTSVTTTTTVATKNRFATSELICGNS